MKIGVSSGLMDQWPGSNATATYTGSTYNFNYIFAHRWSLLKLQPSKQEWPVWVQVQHWTVDWMANGRKVCWSLQTFIDWFISEQTIVCLVVMYAIPLPLCVFFFFKIRSLFFYNHVDCLLQGQPMVQQSTRTTCGSLPAMMVTKGTKWSHYSGCL